MHGEATICLPLGSLIDLKAEAARMAKEAGKIAAEMEKIEKKLSNEKFVANAKEEVVQAERERLAELKDAAARVATAEARIREAGWFRPFRSASFRIISPAASSCRAFAFKEAVILAFQGVLKFIEPPFRLFFSSVAL